MAFTISDSTAEPRSFSLGPMKLQIMKYTALATDTSATVTCDRLSRVSHIMVDGGLTHTAAPTYSTNVATLAVQCPTQVLYTYTVSSASATVGALYTDAHGATYSVAATIAGATTLTAYGDNIAPAASGTLTKLAGTGDATITYSAFTVPSVAGTILAFGI